MEKTKESFENLSNKWKTYLQSKKELPQNKFSVVDYKKIKLLRNNFSVNLENYNYKSVIDKTEISISEDNLFYQLLNNLI